MWVTPIVSGSCCWCTLHSWQKVSFSSIACTLPCEWVVLIAFVSVSLRLSRVCYRYNETLSNSKFCGVQRKTPKTMHLSGSWAEWKWNGSQYERAHRNQKSTKYARRRRVPLGLQRYFGAIVADCFVLLLFLLRVKHSACELILNASTPHATHHENRLNHFFVRHIATYSVWSTKWVASGMRRQRIKIHCEQASLDIFSSLNGTYSISFSRSRFAPFRVSFHCFCASLALCVHSEHGCRCRCGA